MHREMRRKKQHLTEEDSVKALERGNSGVLSLIGLDGSPYGVPLNYLYRDSCLFFHCAVEGYKLDCINKDSRASFCVIDKDETVPSRFTSYFRSVIVSGRVEIITDDKEKYSAIEALADKYCDIGENDIYERVREVEIERSWARLCLLRLNIEHISGKQAIELV